MDLLVCWLVGWLVGWYVVSTVKNNSLLHTHHDHHPSNHPFIHPSIALVVFIRDWFAYVNNPIPNHPPIHPSIAFVVIIGIGLSLGLVCVRQYPLPFNLVLDMSAIVSIAFLYLALGSTLLLMAIPCQFQLRPGNTYPP